MPDTTQFNEETAPVNTQESTGTETSFSQVNDRLKEIVEAVEDDNLPLDDALSLFEEAVSLGMQASSLLEQDLQGNEKDSDQDTPDSASSPATQESPATAPVADGEDSLEQAQDGE